MPDTWVFSWEVLWPMVQVIIEPFGPYIGVILAIVAAFVVLGRVLRMGR